MNETVEKKLGRDEVTFGLGEVTCVVCNTVMKWSDETKEWVCGKCGNRAFQTHDCKTDEIYYEYGPEDDYEPIE